MTVIYSRSMFFSTHESYVDPAKYLMKENVCLMFVDEKYAIFCVTKESRQALKILT